jgi:mandelate racemase
MTHGTTSRIRALTVRAVRVPMEHPHQTAGGTVSESPLVLTDVTTEDGTVGHSVVFTYTAAALRPTADLIRNLEPLIKAMR